MKTILLFLCLLDAFGKLQAQQSFGVMSDSIISNFIEEDLIANYDYIKHLTDYRDSIFQRNYTVYQKTGQYFQKMISGGCASKEEIERMTTRLSYIEKTIVEVDERMKVLINDSSIELLAFTLEEYITRIGQEKKLSLILDRDQIWYTGEEVIDLTQALIDLIQKERKEIEKQFEELMVESKEEFERLVSLEVELR